MSSMLRTVSAESKMSWKLILTQDPADATQAVAMVNRNVEENFDLSHKPENNEAVEEYVHYLARNLNSSSHRLDDHMEDRDHHGEDVEADFHDEDHGSLDDIIPDGPRSIRNLMVKTDKTSILSDGVDAVTIYLKLTNGWGRLVESEARGSPGDRSG